MHLIKSDNIFFKKLFPLFQRLKGHTRKHYYSDIIAGLTVGIVLIPQAIAYAYLAGMPPQYGLYASFIPMLIYGLMGTSPQMNVGPVAVSAVLVLAGIGGLAEPFSERYVELVILTGLIVGLVQLAMGILQMGFIVNFLSHPVLSGFISAASIIIIITQLKEFFGLPDVPQMASTFSILAYEVMHLSDVHLLTLTIGVVTLILLVLMKRLLPKLPGTMIVVIIITAMCYFMNWPQYDIRIIGKLPSGLPSFSQPLFNLKNIELILPTVATVTFIGFVESLSIAKALEMKHRSYKIDANLELVSLGIAKIVGSFYQAIPSSGSFTRSALNDSSGAQSGLASITSALLVGLALIVLTPLFYFIPKPVLAAVIIFSVYKLINIGEAKYLWTIRRRDFAMMAITFVLTIVFGIEIGVLSGVILSIIYILFQNSRPLVIELGNIPNTTYYRNVDRFPAIIQNKEYLIVRFDSQVFFANSSYFKDKIIALVESKPTLPKYLILDASNIHDMDSTGLHALEDLYHQLDNRGIHLVISGALGVVRDLFTRSGFFKIVGEKNHFMYVKNAIAYIDSEDHSAWDEAAIQSNF